VWQLLKVSELQQRSAQQQNRHVTLRQRSASFKKLLHRNAVCEDSQRCWWKEQILWYPTLRR